MRIYIASQEQPIAVTGQGMHSEEVTIVSGNLILKILDGRLTLFLTSDHEPVVRQEEGGKFLIDISKEKE